MIEDAHSVRDIYAVVREPSTGAIQLRLKVNNLDYCDLTIAAGAIISDVIGGFGLPPLEAKGQLSLDVASVVQDPAQFPGRDLTVTVRL